MSNVGQAVTTVVGAVVGFYMGGPAGAAKGAYWGYTAGQLIAPADLPGVTGPRLDDLRVQTTMLGAPIPIIYGYYALSGNVIWTSGIIETKNKKKVSGKGGPSQKVTSYTYKTNVAIGICAGPITSIRRIWANGILIYDLLGKTGETAWETTTREEANAALEAKMTVYLGSTSQDPDPVMESWLGVGEVPGYRGLCYVVFSDFELADHGNRIPMYRFEVRCFGDELRPNPRNTLSEIVRDICIRAGIPDEAQDVANLTTQSVTGYAITGVMNARAAIEPLRAYGYFDAVESGFTLKFVTRGQAVAATITANDLAAHAANDGRPAAIEVTRQQDVELPRKLRVSYIQPDRDYEPGEQYAARLTSDAINIRDTQIPICMTDDQAAQKAEVLLFDSWTARNSYRFALGTEFAYLEPTDCLTAPVDGVNERLRIVSCDYSPFGVLDIEAVRDDNGVYTSTATGVGSITVPRPFVSAGPTTLVLLNLPALRDGDSDAGYYAAVRGSGSGWRGAVVLASNDGGDSFEEISTIEDGALIGTLAAAVGDGITTTWDEANEIRVTVPEGATAGFESRTAAALYSGSNTAAIGVDGRWELVQFRSVAWVSAGSYWSLTGLLRGRKGTEAYTGTSLSSDTFVLLSDGGISRISQDVGSYGQARTHEAISIGATTDDPTTQDFASTARALKPFSPVSLAGSRDGSNNLTITWVRRDRLARELMSGADIPLSETAEAYEVDVMNGSTVVRTIAVTSDSAAYSAANQTTDFGSPQSALTVRIYQLSATVGRGSKLEGSV